MIGFPNLAHDFNFGSFDFVLSKRLVWFRMFGLVWFGRFSLVSLVLVGLVWYVWFGRFGFVWPF